MAVGLAMEEIAAAAGVVLVGPDIDQRVTLDLVNEPAGAILNALAREHGGGIIREGNVLRWVQDARGVSSAGPYYVSDEEAARAIREVVGDETKVTRIGGQMIVRSTDEDRVPEVLAAIEQAERGQWSVTIWFVEMGADALDRFGVQIDPSAAGTFIVGDGAAAIAQAVLSVSAHWERERSNARILTRADLLVVQGRRSRFNAVDSVPVRQTSVSPHGTVQTTGYSFVDAGVIIDVECREVPGGVEVSMRPEISQVVGFVGDAPRVARRNLDVAAMVRDGEYIVLAGFDQMVERHATSGGFALAHRKEHAGNSVVMLVCVRRLAVPRLDPL